MDINGILQAEQSIKPKITADQVNNILGKYYGLKVVAMKELNGYDDYNCFVRVENVTSNPYIENVSVEGYVLKIINHVDSRKPEFFQAQNELLEFLNGGTLKTPKITKTLDDKLVVEIQIESPHLNLVRLFEFIPGKMLDDITNCSDNLFYEVGKAAAELDIRMMKFSHPIYSTHKTLWCLNSIPELKKLLDKIELNENRRRLVEIGIAEFEEKVLKKCDQFDTGMIHGDFNVHNILVSETGHIEAILDFGDVHVAPYLYELSNAITYMIIYAKSLDVGTFVLSGYQLIKPLKQNELKVLRTCIVGRLIQSLVIGLYASTKTPDNDYILTTANNGWNMLEKISETTDLSLLEKWQKS